VNRLHGSGHGSVLPKSAFYKDRSNIAHIARGGLRLLRFIPVSPFLHYEVLSAHSLSVRANRRRNDVSNKFVSLALMSAFLSLTLVTPAMAQQQWQTVARMKQTVQKAMDKDKEITAFLKHPKNGKTKLKGRVKQITDDGLTLTYVNTGNRPRLLSTRLRKFEASPRI
jgi:hypothetical protein